MGPPLEKAIPAGRAGKASSPTRTDPHRHLKLKILYGSLRMQFYAKIPGYRLQIREIWPHGVAKTERSPACAKTCTNQKYI